VKVSADLSLAAFWDHQIEQQEEAEAEPAFWDHQIEQQEEAEAEEERRKEKKKKIGAEEE
jgi:hypothetical protein